MPGQKPQTALPKVYSSGSSGVPEPDEKTTVLENKLVQETGDSILALKDLKLEDKLDETIDKDGWRTDLPRRPGFGTTGEQIKLWTNYFHMNITKGTFHRYTIKVEEASFEKDVATVTAGGESSATATARGSAQNVGGKAKTGGKDGPSGKQLARIIELLLAHDDYSQCKDHVVSDFSATLLSTTKLPRNPMITTLRYQMEGESPVSEKAKQYKVTVEETESFDLSYLDKYLQSQATYGAFENREWFIQALNIFLRHHARTSPSIATLGRKAFPIDGNAGEEDLRHCLSALRGFYSSVRLATSRILVNVNISNSTFYKVSSDEAWRLDIFMSIFEEQVTGTKRSGEIETVRNANYSLQNLEIFLQGLRIQTRHTPEGVNKIRRIHGLAHVDDGRHPGHLLKYPPIVPSFGAKPMEVKFYDSPETMNKMEHEIREAVQRDKGKGETKGKGSASSGRAPTNDWISVGEFIKQEYGHKVQGIRDPVVNVGTEHRPVYLSPFFCWVVPGQVYKRQLGPKLMEQMHEFALRKPWENAASIKSKGFDLVGLSTKNPTLKEFGVQVKQDLITVKGRILAHPKVKYGSGQLIAKIESAEWNMLGSQFFDAKPLDKWACLRIKMGSSSFEEFKFFKKHLDAFTTQLRKCGMQCRDPVITEAVVIRDEKDPQLEAKIRALAGKFEFLLVVLPKKHTLLYNKVKLFGDVRYGIHTVCVVGSAAKFNKEDPKYLANVAHKVNLKLKGINHTLETPQLGIIAEGKTMVLGYDVTHPAPGSNKQAPSIAAMVASIDKHLAQWPADIYKNTAKQEMVDALGTMFTSRLKLWQKENGTLPENILIYRDGVSEGQYKTVLDTEVRQQLRPVCQALYPAPQQQDGFPRLTFIVVGKRHHTRFYPTTALDTPNRTRQIDAKTANTVPGTIVDRGVTEARNWDFFLQAHRPMTGTAKPAHYVVLLDEIFKNTPLPPGGGFANRADVLEHLTHNMCYLFGRATKAVSVCPPAYYADVACERARRYLDRFFGTPDQAYSRATDDRVLPGARDEEVRVSDRLKDSMFYI